MLLLAASLWLASPADSPVQVSAPAAARPACPYAIDRKRQHWLYASAVPRYVYYPDLQPGDGTRRAQLGLRLVLSEEAQQEATLELVLRESGPCRARLALSRTLADEHAGLDLSDATKLWLRAELGAGRDDLRLATSQPERTRSGGWIRESLVVETGTREIVALLGAKTLSVEGPGRGWQPVLDDGDREALRWFLWQHAPDGPAELEAARARGETSASGDRDGAGGGDGGDVERR